MAKKNRLAEAFRENYNLVGLAGAVALSAATLNPLPLLVGVIAEAAYLLFVPDSKWYEVRLSRKFDAEVEARRAALKAQIFPRISGAMQDRFSRLESIRAQVAANPPPGNEDDLWFREVLRKLDYLLEKFLMFAEKEARFRAYLQSVYEQVRRDRGAEASSMPPRRPGGGRNPNIMPASVPDYDLFDAPRDRRGRPSLPRRGEAVVIEINAAQDERAGGAGRLADRWARETVTAIQNHYQSEIQDITEEQAAEEDLNTKAILTKRIEVLEQRGEYVGKIGKILINLGHQMELLEDSFGLINDQMRARSPEQILADIEGVVYQTDSMTKLLEELAPYDQSSEDRLAA